MCIEAYLEIENMMSLHDFHLDSAVIIPSDAETKWSLQYINKYTWEDAQIKRILSKYKIVRYREWRWIN